MAVTETETTHAEKQIKECEKKLAETDAVIHYLEGVRKTAMDHVEGEQYDPTRCEMKQSFADEEWVHLGEVVHAVIQKLTTARRAHAKNLRRGREYRADQIRQQAEHEARKVTHPDDDPSRMTATDGSNLRFR